jgi:hypothetical protein
VLYSLWIGRGRDTFIEKAKYAMDKAMTAVNKKSMLLAVTKT